VRRRGALAVPNFRAYFVGASVAQCGSWLLRTTQAWLVLDLTGSAAALGLVIAAQALPVTILTLFSGVVLDRSETRRVLVGIQVIFFVQAAVLAVLVLTNQIQFWQVVLLAGILGLASAVDFPARSAIVSELVPPPLVSNGIALNSALNSAARIVGPGVGGLLLAVWGSGVCFVVTAITYVGATAALYLVRADQMFPKRMIPSRAMFRQLGEGLRYSFSTPFLTVNMLLAGVFGTFAYNWALVLPLFARFALETGAEGFGALNVAMGVGSTIGAFVLATRVSPTLRLLLLSAGVFAGAIALLAFVPNLWVALPWLVCTGVLSTFFNATNNTLLQVEAREDFRGRVLSLYTLLMVGSSPLGGAITGAVAYSFDIRVALLINAAICLGGLAVAGLILRRTVMRSSRMS
jgi:MFS family permease